MHPKRCLWIDPSMWVLKMIVDRVVCRKFRTWFFSRFGMKIIFRRAIFSRQSCTITQISIQKDYWFFFVSSIFISLFEVGLPAFPNKESFAHVTLDSVQSRKISIFSTQISAKLAYTGNDFHNFAITTIASNNKYEEKAIIIKCQNIFLTKKCTENWQNRIIIDIT